MSTLVTVAEVEARFKTTFTGDDLTQIEALLEDASNLVRVCVAPELDDTMAPLTGNLRALIPIIVNMVRRARENPRGLTGEQLGDYGWQAQSAQTSVYLTRNEKRLIRKIVGVLGVKALVQEGDLPLLVSSEFEELGFTIEDIFASSF